MNRKTLDFEIRNDSELMNRLVKELGCVYFSYEAIIHQAIRERYSIDEELAIQRQRDAKPEEFAEYNAYVEECKAAAKEKWERQEEALSRLLTEYTA